VAKSIGKVIGATQTKEGYLEGNGYIVTWCVGHLVELEPPESYDEKLKKWSYESLPIIPDTWRYGVKNDTKAQYNIVKKLLNDKNVSTVTEATDAGREGELIFRLVYDKSGCTKPIKRLWISSMEESAIKDGFANLKQGSDYDNLYKSALCRQQADWLVGLNGTRLFTVLYGGKVLKVGRVQTPTLEMIVEREKSIRNFKKEAYYTTHITADGIDAVTEHIKDRGDAEKAASECLNGQATVSSVTKERKSTAPPKLYDLTTLQRDANRLFGYTAKQTLEYLQSLYEKKLATYPRTDSQYLSEDMGQTAENVINAILETMPFAKDIQYSPDVKKVLNSGKVTDHHAIIPTVETAKTDLSSLPEHERNVLSLVANRLLCATGEKHIYETVKAELDCNGHTFRTSGKTVIEKGWKTFEEAFKRTFKTAEEKGDDTEKALPELTEGQAIENVHTNVSEHFTKPKPRFTEDTILSMMERAGAEDMGDDVERKGLGTPATRAEIIEKLVKDGFVKREKKQLIPTEDGINLISVLPDVVKSPKLTADWENELTLVAKGEVSADGFMDKITAMVKELVKTYNTVSDENKKLFKPATQQETLGKCPNCGGDVVKGKFGAYCQNKCGMNVSKAMGTTLTDSQIKTMLSGKKTLVKGLKGKKGNFDAYLIPEGVEEYNYTKDEKQIKTFQYKVRLEFVKK
jgi:DNA topoisomerase-3